MPSHDSLDKDVLSTMSIRRGEPKDVGHIRQLVRDSYRQYVFGDGTEPAPMSADYASLVADGHTWVVEYNAHVVGLLVLEPQDAYLLLENIAVQREMRGIGVGSSLMLFAERQAVALDLPEIRLYTGEVMTQNLYYCPRHGYNEIGRETVKGRARVWFAKSVKST